MFGFVVDNGRCKYFFIVYDLKIYNIIDDWYLSGYIGLLWKDSKFGEKCCVRDF